MAAHAAPLRSPAPVAKTKIEPLTYRVKMHLSTTLDNVISEAKQYVEREHAEGRREVEVLQYICWILNEVQKSIHAEYAGFQKRLADDIWGVVREAAKETLKDGPGRPRGMSIADQYDTLLDQQRAKVGSLEETLREAERQFTELRNKLLQERESHADEVLALRQQGYRFTDWSSSNERHQGRQHEDWAYDQSPQPRNRPWHREEEDDDDNNWGSRGNRGNWRGRGGRRGGRRGGYRNRFNNRRNSQWGQRQGRGNNNFDSTS